MTEQESGVRLRNRAARLLGQVQRPDRYREVLIASGQAPIALSVWDSPGEGPVVVFLPGTAVHPLFYEEFLNGLAEAGCPVVGVHPQAHGRSPRVARPLRWNDLVMNAVDACRWAEQHFHRPIVLMGSSQGGLLLLAAVSAPGVAGVVAHNVFDPTHPTMTLTRLARTGASMGVLRAALSSAAAIAPRLPVPITAYLDTSRVFARPWTKELYELDPLSRHAYPLRFMADLMNADVSPLFDGSLTVPVVVLASSGDPLFPIAGIRDISSRLVAPSVELVVLDTDCHLILNEALELALPAVLRSLRGLVPWELRTDRVAGG